MKGQGAATTVDNPDDKPVVFHFCGADLEAPLTPEEAAAAERRIVCVWDDPSLTPLVAERWAEVLAARARIGRVLFGDDLRLVVGADGRNDG